MAGLVAIYGEESFSHQRKEKFEKLLNFTCQFKNLPIPDLNAVGHYCVAAKIDAPTSLHRGIAHDAQSGSWLLIAGTVVGVIGENDPVSLADNLLRDYLSYGIGVLDHYDGHFGLIFYNGRDGSLSIISDPLGLFSLFYLVDGKQIYIASSALSIAKLTSSKPDLINLEHFLRMGRLDGEMTFWIGIKRLGAGKVLKLFPARRIEKIYWAPTYDLSISKLPFREAIENVSNLFTDLTSRAFRNEGVIWADLTGGFDSRFITTFLEKAGIPFVSYCTGSNQSIDVKLARLISSTMGWDFHHINFPEEWDSENFHWFDDAIGAGDGLISVLNLATALRGHNQRIALSKVTASGIGGENWRGYYWLSEGINICKAGDIHYDRLLDRLFSDQLPGGMLRKDRSGEVRKELAEFIKSMLEEYKGLPKSVALDRIEIYRDAGHGGAFLSSAVGFTRSINPFCFKEAVNCGISTNYLWKLPKHHKLIRTILERENLLLASLPTTTGGPAVPIRVGNLILFLPLWEKLVVSISRKLSLPDLKKILSTASASEQSTFTFSWHNSLFMYALFKDLLNPKDMCSGNLYNIKELHEGLVKTELMGYFYYQFFDRVITIELALRATGTSVD
jgi:hypothetical protein